MVRDEEVFDVVIIGAGVIGSATAASLDPEKKVLLVDQFTFLHQKGSSHGESRIFRLAYPTQHHTELCIEAMSLWQQFERQSSEKVLQMTGGLDFAKQGNVRLQQLKQSLQVNQIAYYVYDNTAAIRSKFPQFHQSEEDYEAVHTKQAGILNATKAVGMLQKIAQQNHVAMKENCKIVSIDEVGDLIQISSTQEQFFCRKCIITAGAWTGKLLKSWFPAAPPISLNPIQTFVAYWPCKTKESEKLFCNSAFPVFINYDEPLVYGFPVNEMAGHVKISLHNGPDCDPDSRDFTPGKDALKKLSNWIQGTFDGVSDQATRTESCMYTMTPNHDFILDFLPNTNKNIIIGAGFSGHGFKMAPTLGKILAELAVKGNSAHDLSSYSFR